MINQNFLGESKKGIQIDAWMGALSTNQIANGSPQTNHKAGFERQYEDLL